MKRKENKQCLGVKTGEAEGEVFFDRTFYCRARKGFSLIEILMVIVVLSIVAALTLPAISGMQRSYELSKASALVRDNLQLARQLAITRNSQIVASICKVQDAQGSESFNTILISRVNDSGGIEDILKPVRLPEGICIVEDDEWSSLMNAPSANVVFRSGTVPARQIGFKANGSTTLAASSNWFLTLYFQRDGSVPGPNFSTLAMDPVTGRVFVYQP